VILMSMGSIPRVIHLGHASATHAAEPPYGPAAGTQICPSRVMPARKSGRSFTTAPRHAQTHGLGRPPQR